MKRRDYQDIKRIFQSAVELHPAARTEFLDRECEGNRNLRLEVERLLESEDSRFMDEVALVQVADIIDDAEIKETKVFSKIEKGTQFGHYRIVSRIGKGGMGEVFLAKDTSLDRQVAIKFLSRKLSHDWEKLNRFEQEAKAASSLNHPNIITIYEIGKAPDGSRYIASEYVEGKDLDVFLSEEKRSLNKIIEIAVQLASALEAAHSSGIIHRDVKPANIRIRKDGLVKILDFGLAKLALNPVGGEVSHGASTLIRINTASGVVMGTPNYMSPEQARGMETDARTDIFTLGIILYEMLSGINPFSAESITDTLMSIVEKRSPRISDAVGGLPEKLIEVVDRSLSKDPADRYQTAAELLEDLERIPQEYDKNASFPKNPTASRRRNQVTGEKLVPPTAIRNVHTNRDSRQGFINAWSILHTYGRSRAKPLFVACALIVLLAASYFLVLPLMSTVEEGTSFSSLAILPFKTESADSEYLSNGIGESLINRFSQLEGIEISTRSSVNKYKGRSIDTKEIKEDLNVEVLLTGRVAVENAQIEVQTVLIDTSTGKQVWGDSFRGGSSDLINIEEEIVRQITKWLRVDQSNPEQAKRFERFTNDGEAYRYYLKGRYFADQSSLADLRKSEELYKKSLEIDSKYALSWAGLADLYSRQASLEYLQDKNELTETRLKIESALRKAIEYAPNVSETRVSLGNHKLRNWEFREAEAEYEKALSIDPDNHIAHGRFGRMLRSLGRFEEALSEFEWIEKRFPVNFYYSCLSADTLYRVGRTKEANRKFESAMDLDPRGQVLLRQAARFQSLSGDHSRAIETIRKAIEYDKKTFGYPKGRKPFDPFLESDLGVIYSLAGKEAEARRKLGELLEGADSGATSAYHIAKVYGALGDKESAFTWLRKSFENREHLLRSMLVEDSFKSLHSDPRWDDLLRKVGIRAS